MMLRRPFPGLLLFAAAAIAGHAALASNPFRFGGPMLLAVLASGPAVLVLALIPRRAALILAQAVAGLATAVLVVLTFADRPGHSSPGDALAPLLLFLIWIGLAAELAVLHAALRRAQHDKRVFVTVLAASLAGLMLALAIWNFSYSPRVIAAAERIAAGRPYCIEAAGNPVDRRAQLSPLAMRAPNRGGWSWNFHGLLVVGEGPERAYWNWSYRRKGFMPVSDRARTGLRLDEARRCTPRPHFAPSLP